MGVDGEPDQVEIDPAQPEATKKIIDPETGEVIKSIYNPGVGKYDVCVTTGPSYTTKRQESAEAMSNIVQGNPELWAVVGDLIVKNMDWPGADEFAERLKRMVDPKLLTDQQSPELVEMQKQMQELQQLNQQMSGMLKNVQQSFEQQELEIKKFDAETKRISAVQAGMTMEQIQEIVIGTIDGMVDLGNLPSNPSGVINSNPPEQQIQPQPQGEI